LILIILLALFLRFFNYYEMKRNNPIFEIPIVDSAEYIKTAEYILDKNFLGISGSYYHPPFYYYFIALILKIFNRSVNVIKIIQVFLDLAIILMTYYLARRIFNQTVAVIASFLYAIYLPVIQANLEILPSVLLSFLLLSSVFSLSNFYKHWKTEKPRFKWLGIAGLSYGLLIITLPNFLIILPIILWWCWSMMRRALNFCIKYIVFFFIIVLIPAFLVTLRNYLYAHEPVIISYNGGINFFVGNNAEIEKTIAIQPGYQWDSLMTVAYLSERITDFSRQQNFWYKKGIDFIIKRPLNWLLITTKKTILFFNAFEFPRNTDEEFFGNFSAVNKLPLVRADLVFPLCLAGIVYVMFFDRSRREKGMIKLIILIFFGYALTIIIIFVSSRYRLPIISFFCIFAGYSLYKLWDSIGKKNYQIIIKMLSLLIPFIIFTQMKFFKDSYPYKKPLTLSYIQICRALIENQRTTEAEGYLKKCFSLPPDEITYERHYTAGLYYNKIGDTEKAIENFKEAWSLNPHFYYALNQLGFIYKKRQMLDSAIYFLKKACAIPHWDAIVYYNLADCYLMQNNITEAMEVLKSFIREKPSPHPVIFEGLARLYMKEKDYLQAIYYFKQAITYPHAYEINPEVFNLIGICYYNIKDLNNARRYWRMGLKKDPNYRPILQNLMQLK
ncbi:MAG: glycosyltransferase family 39 protein, partial [candidate division WOR-3 bacterium]